MIRGLFPAIAILLTVGTATAQVGTPIPSGQTVTIDAHGECRQVTNPASGTRMVFTGTAAEWTSFRNNPNGLTMADCGPNCGRLWTTVSLSSGWTGITFGGGKFVAVGSSGVATSTNGTTWLTTALPGNWRSVAYGNGIFVAVASSGTNRVATSTNGTTWTGRSVPNSFLMYGSVVFGAGRFVAAANDFSSNPIITSTDGITWTEPNVPGLSYNDLAFGNGIYLAMKGNEGALIRSTNGTTWTSHSLPAGNWRAITFGAGKFVSVSDSGSTMVSTNGTNWTVSTGAPVNRATAIAFGNGVFVATGSNGSMMSEDGVNWLAGNGGRGSDLVAGQNKFVAVNGQQIHISDCSID